jgi:hypothetical protein
MKRRSTGSLKRPRLGVVAAQRVCALLLVLLGGTVLAQATPRLGLIAPTRIVVGDDVRLEATDLADLPYTLRVERPDGERTSESIMPRAGRLVAAIATDLAGSYRINLEGPALEAFFTLVVHEPEERSPTAGAEATERDAALPAAAFTLESSDLGVRALEPSGLLRWRLSFPRGSGEIGPTLSHAGRAWLALGHQLLIVDGESGEVRYRIATSGPIVALMGDPDGVRVQSLVSAPGGTLLQEAVVVAGSLRPAAIFDPIDAELFRALQQESDVIDVAERLEVDLSNPYLWQQVALHALDDAEREQALERLWPSIGTFYDAARIARIFATAELWPAAQRAMELAQRDFEERGYDPALLTSVMLHERYGFPLQPLQRAIERDERDAADFWAGWLFELSGPDLPGAGAALRSYASLLAAHGQRDEATLWRERAALRSNPSAAEILARNAVLVGRGSAIVSAGLMLALITLHLTLFFKYRRAQLLSQRRAHIEGRTVPRWGVLLAIRYSGLTEKLVLLMLLAAAYSTVVLFTWVERGDAVAPHLSAGHLGTPVIDALLPSAAGSPEAVAELQRYRLAVQPEEGRSALAAQGPAPSPATLRAAFADTWTRAIGRAFLEPWRLFNARYELLGLPGWLWPAQLALFWMVALWHLTWLLVPRPRYAADAPRTPTYHLLALLIPGSGQADELYGILLIVPWATFGIDVLMQLFGAASPLGIPLPAAYMVLGVLYLVNLLAWSIEFASVRRRTLDLKRNNPELAREFGLHFVKAPSELA